MNIKLLHTKQMDETMKRQKFSPRKQKWILQELRGGAWLTIAERDGTNDETRQIGRWIGVPVTDKPQFRG